MRSIRLGEFQIISGNVIVSDPCYELDIWCLGKLSNVRKGKWEAHILVSDEGAWGNRVAELVAECVEPGETGILLGWEPQEFKVGVDSGQAGIFDREHYRDDSVVKGVSRKADETIRPEEPWYSICCDRTLSEPGAGIVPFGVVSSSGFGDGSYRCYLMKTREGIIQGIKIVFIEDEEDSEW